MFMFCYISDDKLPLFPKESKIILTNLSEIWSAQHGLRVGYKIFGTVFKGNAIVSPATLWCGNHSGHVHRGRSEITGLRPLSAIAIWGLQAPGLAQCPPTLDPWSHTRLLLLCGTPVSVGNKSPVLSLQHTPTNLINFPSRPSAPASALPQLCTLKSPHYFEYAFFLSAWIPKPW